MKKHIIYLLASGFVWLSGMALGACSDDDAADANDVLAVKSVLPTKVMEGQVVTITGTGLEKATSVVFPGNVSVTDITKVGNGYISVVTPAGISAEGGTVIVEAGDGELAESAMTLTVGKPTVSRVAPLDKEIKINECVEVYGSDLEFITKAYFPGEDGSDVVVEASDFKRKATGSLYIYSPMGIKAGAAQISIEDCSGKKYVLPEVTLSDKVAGGSDAGNEEVGLVIWEGPLEITSWNWFEPSYTEFNLGGYVPLVGQVLKFVISSANDDSRFCYCYGDWGGKDLGGENDINNIGITSATKEVLMNMDEKMVTDFTSGNPVFHVSGTNFVIERIVLEPITIWEGEQYIEPSWANWIYFSADNLAFGDIIPEAGMTLRIHTADHDSDITFCLCLGWGWWAPDLDGAGNNTITVPAGTNTVDCLLTEDGATNLKDQIILGGSDWTVTKLELFGAKIE